MRSEHCLTRNHIEVFHNRVLSSGPQRIRFRTLVYGSTLPLLVWTGIAGFLHHVFNPIAPMVLCGLFVTLIALGFALRRRRKHSVRCSFYGALGAVLAGSMDGF
ncbi:hypothetical protein [Streptomyces tendae]|uniref:Uncharacterized protein n=1 Tax=Streptomyces tendae TaxID=1932 RepID=A0ABX5ZLI0_STRTE|nr:hypothetical protein [Streptomyces tendae]QER84527.1 hypothetical protein F3L20_00395 [Streptomyces tendae]